MKSSGAGVVRALASIVIALLLITIVIDGQSRAGGANCAARATGPDLSKLKDPAQLTETAPDVFRARR